MRDAVLFELAPDLGDHVSHEVFTLCTVAVYELDEFVVILGMEIS